MPQKLHVNAEKQEEDHVQSQSILLDLECGRKVVLGRRIWEKDRAKEALPMVDSTGWFCGAYNRKRRCSTLNTN